VSIVNFIINQVNSDIGPRRRSSKDGILEFVEEKQLETGIFTVSLGETETVVREVRLTIQLVQAG